MSHDVIQSRTVTDVAHPAWCVRSECGSKLDVGEVVVHHQATLFDEHEIALVDGRLLRSPISWSVQLIRVDNLMPDGRVETEGTRLWVTPAHDNGLTAGPLMQGFTRAVALAGHLMATEAVAAR